MKKRMLVFAILIFVLPQLSFAQCTDTDNGDNRTHLGIASNRTFSYTDTCDGLNIVNEGTCEGNNVVTLLNQECPAEADCYNGRCIFFEVTPCEDTDSGIDYEEYGIVTRGRDTILRDICRVNGHTRLTEYYCESGSIRSVDTICEQLCYSGRCAIDENDNGIPDELEISEQCEVNEIFWSDGYEHNLEEAGVGLPVYGFVTGENCGGTTFTLSILDASDGSVVEELGEFIFGYDEESAIWYNLSSWVPSSDGEYYLSATVYGSGYSYTRDNSATPLRVRSDCEPQPLPENLECGNDPETGEQLPSGNDFDCDGVDDCIDQWVYNYGGDIDPNDGVPLGMSGCLGEWDCRDAQWSECAKNAEGRLTRTRDITRCVLPEGSSCPIAPSDEKLCLIEEEFPIFGWFNILIVFMLITGYYFINKKVVKL